MHELAKKYVDMLQLKLHPEGGYYKEDYRAGELILPDGLPSRYDKPRAFSTSIYFLLEGKQFSAFHRLKTDELWHFYDGSSLKIYMIDEKDNFNEITLGKDLNNGETFQAIIKKNTWFAAELIDKNSFALIGCTVAPGFEFSDFELGKREQLVEQYPQYRNLIEQLIKS